MEFKEYTRKMEKTMEVLGSEFGSVRAGRANASVLDRITVVLWKSGVQIVLFLAGLQGISSSLYEAARVDGATEWEMFWKITLPMITPVILMNAVYTIVSFFTDATNPIVDYIYKQSFGNPQQFAHGAAMGWMYFAFAFALCILTIGVMRNFVFASGEGTAAVKRPGKRRSPRTKRNAAGKE